MGNRLCSGQRLSYLRRRERALLKVVVDRILGRAVVPLEVGKGGCCSVGAQSGNGRRLLFRWSTVLWRLCNKIQEGENNLVKHEFELC